MTKKEQLKQILLEEKKVLILVLDVYNHMQANYQQKDWDDVFKKAKVPNINLMRCFSSDDVKKFLTKLQALED